MSRKTQKLPRCPHCGKPLTGAGTWDRKEYTAFGLNLNEAIAIGANYERRVPSREATIESDVAVPGAQAAITAIILGTGAGAFAAIVGAPQAPLIGVSIGTATATVTWLGLLADHRRSLWTLEKVVGVDIDGDDSIGDPRRRKEPVTVEIIDRGNKSMRYVGLGLDEHELKRVAEALIVRREPLSRRGLEDVLEPERYSDFLDTLLETNLAQLKGKSRNAGVELSEAGRYFFKKQLEN